MLYITVTGWANSPESRPFLQIAEAMHDQGAGNTQEILGSLESLPARLGPFATFQQAQSVNRLLMGYGALSAVVEE